MNLAPSRLIPFFLLLIAGAVSPALAEIATFTVDPARSSVTLSGSASGAPLQEQGPGSLQASFEGTMVLDVSAAGVRFTGDSRIRPDEADSWQPGPSGADGSSPASYGGQAKIGSGFFAVSAVAATRRLLLDIISPQLPLQGTSFDATGITFGFVETNKPVLDYKTSGLLSRKDGLALSGLATNSIAGDSTLVTEGSTQTLTLQVKATYVFELLVPGDSSLSLTGQLVATRTLSAAPPALVVQPVPVGATSMTLSWPAGFKLQRATRLENSDWADTGAVSPATIPFTGDGELFQVVPQ